MLKAIIKLVSPPVTPVEPGRKKDWPAVEKELGTKLPTDYKEFVHAYGTGLFAGFYRVYNPFSSSPNSNLLHRFRELTEQYRQSHADEPDRFPYGVFPDESLGLIPWGDDENGNYYFWLAKGKPDAWTIVSDETRGDGMQEHKVTLTGFLTGILAKQIKAHAGNCPQRENFRFEPFLVRSDPAELLHDAVAANDLSRVRELLDAGANPDGTYGGSTPLALAVQEKRLDIARLLLEKGAGVNARTGGGPTALFDAAQYGGVAAVRLLLDAGADVSLADESRGTALFPAIDGEDMEVVQMLLKAGAEVDVVDRANGSTPLHRAVNSNKPELLKLLLACKPKELSLVDRYSETPLSYAMSFGDKPEIVKMLKEAGAK